MSTKLEIASEKLNTDQQESTQQEPQKLSLTPKGERHVVDQNGIYYQVKDVDYKDRAFSIEELPGLWNK